MGGSNASNTNGTITSTVRANPTYGQSIVSWTGTGTGSSPTVGHGLSSAPEFFVVRHRNASGAWPAQHKYDTTKYFQMQDVDAAGTAATVFDNTAPTSSVFTINATNAVTNLSGGTYIAYCWHSVVGYSKIDSYSGTGSAGLAITTGFAPAFVVIKSTALNNWYVMDSVRTDNDGRPHVLQIDNNSVETTETSITFTSTGFTINVTNAAMNANGTTYIYMAFADKREYAYWLDQSGNNNDWTSNNLTESDIMVDSPTNNFATQNPLAAGALGVAGGGDAPPTFSEGNLRIVTALTPAGRNVSTIGVTSGKYYAEMYHEAGVSGEWVSPRTVVGITTNSVDTIRAKNGGNIGSLTSSEDVGYAGDDGRKNVGNSWSAYGATWTIGDIIGVALDMDNDQVTFYKNNASQGAISFTAGGEGHFACGDTSAGGGLTAVWNYGQDSSFAGQKTAQGNQDGNDIGDFYYTPPTGFLALCTSNLPDVAVIPSEHFNSVLYAPDGSSSFAVTGVGFQPDLVWLKSRTYAEDYQVNDAVRGVQKGLQTNSTRAETAQSNGLTAFGSDGFTVGNLSDYNYNGDSIIAWNWKANGSGSSNTNGTINTTATSANVDAGFSIVSYTGTGTNGATVGHGLSKAPELVIAKERDIVEHWTTGSDELGWGNVIWLNRTVAYTSGAWAFNSASPSSTLVTLGAGGGINSSGKNMIMYCFHSVDGYSKVGSYVGNSNVDGTFIYTGFRPAYFLCKNIAQVEGWEVWDGTREPYNLMTKKLSPNTTEVEWTSSTTHYAIDFLSNGVKLRTTYSAVNNNAQTFIYLAFAETPFKYSNAR
jgi:hypothetical protein